MRLFLTVSCLALTLAACNVSGAGDKQDQPAASGSTAATQPAPASDSLAASDPAMGATLDQPYPDPEARPLMQAQVILDRLGFTPGVVDGKMGLSTRNALSGFQEANQLTVTGEFDEPTKAALGKWMNIPATRVVTIPAAFAAGPFYKVPDKPADQAKMPGLGYETLDEKLAERFHTTIETLKALNPGGAPAGLASSSPSASASASPSPSASAAASGVPQPGPASLFAAGQMIRVPNIGGDAIDAAQVSNAAWRDTLAALGVGSNQPQAARVVVSKSKETLKAYDEAGKLIAVYTATMGSKYDPLPLGKWAIKGKAYNPPFNYNPDLFWDARAGDKKALLPPGPNGPVGVVWIDISKDHYGIHGTPNPETIGRAESHGCVRLTNWDVARLAQMVTPKTQLLFEA